MRRGGLAQIASRNEYDKTIAETEAAYMKILESSQTLLNVLKRETVNLVKCVPSPLFSAACFPRCLLTEGWC